MRKSQNIIIFAVAFMVCIVVILETNISGEGAEPYEEDNMKVESDTTKTDRILQEAEDLSGAKSFISGTFDKINENFYVKISGTSETAKTAEPELYQSMREKGETLIPAILSLLLEDREGRIDGELVILCDDILADMGEDPLDWDNSNPSSPSIFGKRTIELYEKYVGSYRPITKNDTRVAKTIPQGDDTPRYVWTAKADPSVNIPEPDEHAEVPDYVRWEPMLGWYILKDAYYNEDLGMIVLEEIPE